MRRYLIILSALFAAIMVMSLIKSWQKRQAVARGGNAQDIKGITSAHLFGALAGLLVFFFGVVVLEDTASAPEGTYRPATLADGVVSSGGFEVKDNVPVAGNGDAQ